MTEHIARTPFADLDQVPPQVRAMLIAALDQMAAHPQIQRVRRVARKALAPRSGQRLLDVGCGVGEVARELATLVAPDGEVVAVDLSAATVAVAAERHDTSNVRYAVGDIAALDFPDADFDGVRTERVLQHVTDPDASVAELARVVRPGGRVCLVDTDWESLALDGMPEGMVSALRTHADNRPHAAPCVDGAHPAAPPYPRRSRRRDLRTSTAVVYRSRGRRDSDAVLQPPDPARRRTDTR